MISLSKSDGVLFGPFESDYLPEAFEYQAKMVEACLNPERHVGEIDFSRDVPGAFYLTCAMGEYPQGITDTMLTEYKNNLVNRMSGPFQPTSHGIGVFLAGMYLAPMVKKSGLDLPNYSIWKTSFVNACVNLPDSEPVAFENYEKRGIFGEIALCTRLAYPHTPFDDDANVMAQKYLLDTKKVMAFLNEDFTSFDYALAKLCVLACVRLLYPTAYAQLNYTVDWPSVYKFYVETPVQKPDFLFYSRVILAESAEITEEGELKTILAPMNIPPTTRQEVPEIPYYAIF